MSKPSSHFCSRCKPLEAQDDYSIEVFPNQCAPATGVYPPNLATVVCLGRTLIHCARFTASDEQQLTSGLGEFVEKVYRPWAPGSQVALDLQGLRGHVGGSPQRSLWRWVVARRTHADILRLLDQIAKEDG